MRYFFIAALFFGSYSFNADAEDLSKSIQRDVIRIIGKSNLAAGELKRKVEEKSCLGQFYTFPIVEIAHMETLVEVIEDLEAVKHKNLNKYKLKLSLLVSQAKLEVTHGTKRGLCQDEKAPKIDAYESALKVLLSKLKSAKN